MSKRAACIIMATLIAAVWAFIEWRAQPPPPPLVKAFPWENGYFTK